MTSQVPAGPLGEAPMSDDLELSQSVAGEEDPGASIDLASPAAAPGKSDPPAGHPPAKHPDRRRP